MDEKTLKVIRENIRKSEEQLKVLQKDIALAIKGGIDVTESKKLYITLLDRVNLLKSAYQ